MDLGYTDFASVIKSNYIDCFIPNAIKLAKEVNTEDCKNFVWTTGAWILNEALKLGTNEQQTALKEAIACGDIVAHGMPFTTHTELLDKDTLEYGISLCSNIDALRGKKTISAKLTDVPGHSRSIIEPLVKSGIKLLHIGVNGATPLPKLPDCFIWKHNGHELIVIYSCDYGGAYTSKVTGDILYFDHTMDNKGVPSKEKVLAKLASLKEQYPDYNVQAGSMDAYAEKLWDRRAELPIYEGEIGDTWIHGASADPYKAGALRVLMALKQKWLADGTMVKGSEEYNKFTNDVLCLAEHTCGMDSKKFLGDYEHYLKKDFEYARAKDNVRVTKPWRDFPQNYSIMLSRHKGKFLPCSYKAIEKSWQEKHLHIANAVGFLSNEHRQEANTALAKLMPKTELAHFDGNYAYGTKLAIGGWDLTINENGGIGELCYNKDTVVANNNKAIMEYKSFSLADYQQFFDNFIRDFEHTYKWSFSAFGKPLLKYVKNKYPTGGFPYKAKKASKVELKDKTIVLVDMKCADNACVLLGAPRLIQIQYTLTQTGVGINIAWFKKDANRLPEALYLHLYPTIKGLSLQKIGDSIDPKNIVSMGNRNIHAVENIAFATLDNSYKIINHHAPLVALNGGKILEFKDTISQPENTGIAYILHNNVWGTNFALWYESNASFDFTITLN